MTREALLDAIKLPGPGCIVWRASSPEDAAAKYLAEIRARVRIARR